MTKYKSTKKNIKIHKKKPQSTTIQLQTCIKVHKIYNKKMTISVLIVNLFCKIDISRIGTAEWLYC